MAIEDSDKSCVFERAVSTNFEGRLFVRTYAKFLRETLTDLGLTGFKVDDRLSFVCPDEYRNKTTLGLIGGGESTVAILASSQEAGLSADAPQLEVLLIRPFLESSSVLIDREKNRLWADFFWVCRDNNFQPVHTDAPIPLDGAIMMPYGREEYELYGNYFKNNLAVFDLTEDKFATTSIWAEHGIVVPDEALLQKGDEPDPVRRQIEDFFVKKKGVVVKGNGGAHGDLVRMFTEDQTEAAFEYAQYLMGEGYEVILQERVITFSPEEIEEMTKYGDPIPDFNFRVLVTLEEVPRVIDVEIRADKFSQNPVNISKTARAVRIPATANSYWSLVGGVARMATKVLVDAVGRGNLIGTMGIDILTDGQDHPVCIEANVGNVGGYGTLCRLDRGPLAGVANTLIPSAEPVLTKGFHTRSEADFLERVALLHSDLIEIAEIYRIQGRLGAAVEKLRAALPQADDQQGEIFAFNIGDFLRRLKRVDEAIDFLDQYMQKNGSTLWLEFQRAACVFVLTGEDKKMRELRVQIAREEEGIERSLDYYSFTDLYMERVRLGRDPQAFDDFAKAMRRDIVNRIRSKVRNFGGHLLKALMMDYTDDPNGLFYLMQLPQPKRNVDPVKDLVRNVLN